LLKQQVDKADIIDSIQLMTVMRGAGPILMELQNLIKRGKKLIVIDAVSTTDIEQIALAIQKSPFKILPCGSAGLAQALTKCHLPEMKHQHINKVIPTLPIFIVVGSATDVTRTQIRKLMESDEMEPSFTELSPEQVLSVPSDELVNRIIEDMGNDGIVLVHSVPLDGNLSNCTEYAREHGIEPENMPGIVSDFLADLTQKVVEKQSVILITIGGETSYKCCNAIGSKHLQLIDEVEPAIPLCLDHNAQWIITKSGNLGNPSTLINILKYFKKHQEVK
jgi:uncharacterized protein YgbK (DUF1537 family)